ncbi:MAG: hypothetical protein Q9162_006872 [Coniocarpon cinnabarinum]
MSDSEKNGNSQGCVESPLVFRSENSVAQSHVEKRVATKIRQRASREDSESGEQGPPAVDNSQLINTPTTQSEWRVGGDTAVAIQSTPAANVDDHALAFFASNWLIIGAIQEAHVSSGSVSGRGKQILTAALDGAVKALALGSMSTFTKNRPLAVEARKRYGAAVASTNEALSRPELVREDSLLSTVLILNVFEVVGGPDAQSLFDWSNHAYGAASLVQLRGGAQFKSPVGHLLFMSAVSLLSAAVIRDDTVVPPGLLPLARLARSQVTSYHEIWDFLLIKLEMTEFFSAEIDFWPFPKKSMDPELAAWKALHFDNAIARLAERLPPNYQYTAVYIPEMAEFSVDGHCDVYPFFWTAQFWNDMRIHRIILHAIIRHSLNRVSDENARFWSRAERDKQLAVSRSLTLRHQAEVLRCVPQHLGKVSFEHDSPRRCWDTPPVFNFPWTAFKAFRYDPAGMLMPCYQGCPILRSYGGYTLNWALFSASKVEGTSPELMEKIVRLLKTIGMPQGNSQADLMARITKDERQFF